MPEGADGTGTGAGAPFAELVRLQADFQARMAEETLRYLRRMQGLFEPHAPGTVVLPEQPEPMRAQAGKGERCSLTLDVENRQRVHAVVAPALTPLVGDDGTTWFPDASVTPALGLLAPGETTTITITALVPAEVPTGAYRGLLVLRGLRPGGLPIVVDVTEVAAGSDVGEVPESSAEAS